MRQLVALVSPAWQRFAVTRLALAQRAHLAGELAARGIDCVSVVVADDENLDIARGYGMETVELDNDGGLGRRFNAGFRHAAGLGADWLVHIGSDDWLHPDAFDRLPEMAARTRTLPIISGRQIAFVDLLSGRMRDCYAPGRNGVIPWIIPRKLMVHSDFSPIREDRKSGMDGYLIRGLGVKPTWLFHDPNPVGRVDFKSDVNLTPYKAVTGALGRGMDMEPWARLAEHYPSWLVDMARETARSLRAEQEPEVV